MWVFVVQIAGGGSMLSVFLPEGFYQVVWQNARYYFLTSGVCLQARDCIGNTWSHQPMDNLEMSLHITYRRYVQQGTVEEVGLLWRRPGIFCLLTPFLSRCGSPSDTRWWNTINEESAKGYDSNWLNWRCLNRLRTGYTSSKEQGKKWGTSMKA